MPFANLSDIVLVLVLMDVLIVIVFVVFLWKSRSLNIEEGLQKKIEVFESLLGDVDHMSIHLKKDMAKKYLLLKQLNEKIDQRVARLEKLLEKADKTIVAMENNERPATSEKKALTELNQEDQILQMVNDGVEMEEIAGRLSIPRGTVKLVMELKKVNRN